MGRNVYGLRAGFQHDLQQIPAVQPQNRPAVRMNVADQLQPSGQRLRLLQSGQQEQTVHLAHPFLFLINGADLSRHQKARLLLRHALLMNAVFLLQHIKPVLRRFQLFHQLRPPCGMGEISCSQNMNSLFSRHELQMLRIAVLARSPRKPGVNMQISYVCLMRHPYLHRSRTGSKAHRSVFPAAFPGSFRPESAFLEVIIAFCQMRCKCISFRQIRDCYRSAFGGAVTASGHSKRFAPGRMLPAGLFSYGLRRECADLAE